MTHTPDNFPLTLGFMPQGNLRRSDLVNGAYAVTLTLRREGRVKKVTLHFMGGGLAQIRSCERWTIKTCTVPEKRKRKGERHYRCEPAPANATVDANSFFLLKNGQVGLSKKPPQRRPDRTTPTCRPSIAAMAY